MFIEDFLHYTKELESPSSFFLWTSFACIASTLRDNVFVRQGPKNLYPNIYVLLLADSGIARKGQPLSICADLVKKVQNTKVVRGRSSIQAILQDLGSVHMDKAGNQIQGGSCALIADELASFFSYDPFAMAILTDIYDYRDVWDYNLKSSGKLTIKNLCVSMLAASNETHLREVYTKAAVYGGLMGRTFFIKPDEHRQGNSLLDDITAPVNGNYDNKHLVEQLKQMAKLRGGFQVEQGAKLEYDKWYYDLRKKYEEKADKTGVIARIHTGVLKVAMILAVGKTMELILRRSHVEEAIHHCISIIPNYEVFTMATGKAEDAQMGALLFTELLEEKSGNKIARKVFIRNHWTEIDQVQFDLLIEKLVTAGLVKESFENDELFLSLTNLGIEKLEQRKREKNKGTSNDDPRH
jgi:hypothetical protein